MPTKDEIKQQLDAAGVDYPSRANKDELLDLLDAAQEAPAAPEPDADEDPGTPAPTDDPAPQEPTSRPYGPSLFEQAQERADGGPLGPGRNHDADERARRHRLGLPLDG